MIDEATNNKFVGLGLRHPHYKYFIQNRPKIPFVEIHSENFFFLSGANLDFLEKINDNYKLSFHSIGLSLGSADGIDTSHINKLKILVDKFSPYLISDHLSWSKIDGAVANDLLPIMYNQESLDIFCANIDNVQNIIGREILIENPSSYLSFNNSEIAEYDFLNLIADKTGCKILLDINNIFVSSHNNGDFTSTNYLDNIDSNLVKEIHIAGASSYTLSNGKKILIDTHSEEVYDEVWELYQYFLTKCNNPIDTLIEWDKNIPEFEVLYNEVIKASKLIDNLFAKEI